MEFRRFRVERPGRDNDSTPEFSAKLEQRHLHPSNATQSYLFMTEKMLSHQVVDGLFGNFCQIGAITVNLVAPS
jgi:hypothetical protein